LTPDELVAGMSPSFLGACPVTWARTRRVHTLPPDALAADARAQMIYAASWRGKYYCMKGPSQLTAFLLRPAEALARGPVPQPFAHPLSAADAASKSLEPMLKGHCAVTLVRGPKGCDHASRVQSVRLGLKACAVSYDSKVYLMADAPAAAEFVQRPWLYAPVELPPKLPPTAIETIISSLPIRGYLEQTVGELLVGALTQLAELRPIYPTLSRRESALKFVALYIRAKNPKRRAAHLKAKFESSYLDYSDCCAAADKLLQFQKAGGAEAAGGVPDDIDRVNQVWDSVQERDVNDFI